MLKPINLGGLKFIGFILGNFTSWIRLLESWGQCISSVERILPVPEFYIQNSTF